MAEFKSFTELEIEGLAEAGFQFCNDHPCLAPHWYSREANAVRITQVAPMEVRHVTVSTDNYEADDPRAFENLGLELRKVGH